MKFHVLAMALLTVALSLSSARAGLLISEVVYNEPGSDTTGEWIEIFNTGPTAVDLSSYKIGDEETMNPPSAENGGMWQFPAAAIIPANGVQIVAINGTTFFTNYGFKPTYEVVAADPLVPNMINYTAWASNPSPTINMSNSNDQVLLIGGSDQLVDAVGWGNTFAFNPGLNGDAEADGQSYQRINVFVDTDAATDWQLGDPSSPGTVSVPEAGSMSMALLGVFGLGIWRRMVR